MLTTPCFPFSATRGEDCRRNEKSGLTGNGHVCPSSGWLQLTWQSMASSHQWRQGRTSLGSHRIKDAWCHPGLPLGAKFRGSTTKQSQARAEICSSGQVSSILNLQLVLCLMFESHLKSSPVPLWQPNLMWFCERNMTPGSRINPLARMPSWNQGQPRTSRNPMAWVPELLGESRQTHVQGRWYESTRGGGGTRGTGAHRDPGPSVGAPPGGYAGPGRSQALEEAIGSFKEDALETISHAESGLSLVCPTQHC